ncbi:DUF551 domain-containing protein [Serratia nevei]|uniref:DUF551 domain-containing protein n=1 Tax=Serratia nevei TaxID=2703794 RepID=UPI00313A7AB5
MTLTTERLHEIVERRSPSLRWGEAEQIAAELLANREAQPLGFIDPASIKEYRGQRAGGTWSPVQRTIGGLNMTMPIYTATPAPIPQGIDRRSIADRVYGKCMRIPGATFYNAAEFAIDEIGACLAEAMNSAAPPAPAVPDDTRDALRYRFLKDKDAWGCDNEPSLVEWDDLIDLEGSEFDAAIDARIANSDVDYAATPAPAVPDFGALTKLIVGRLIDCGAAGDDSIADAETFVYNACRAAMLAQPVRRGCTVVPLGWIDCAFRVPDTDGNYWGWWSESKRQGPVWFIKSDVQAQFQSSEITHWMPLPAAPEGGNEK